MLQAISPLDGRYENKIKDLVGYFSEYALIRYRVLVEIEYFIHLSSTLDLKYKLTSDQCIQLRSLYHDFTLEQAAQIKKIETTTNHDVKAVEYFIKDACESFGLTSHIELIHFGLTSQDINNTAIPMSLRDFTERFFLEKLNSLKSSLEAIAEAWKQVPMLARTHGQAASPTTVGKELKVFSERLSKQINTLSQFEYSGKFGGATGNFNAHIAAFPSIDWAKWADLFLSEQLKLKRQLHTTQIAHYDELAEWMQLLIRINSILLDFSRDIWLYISMDFFGQKTIEGEIGSSAMPHKVNPIDFENAEGNLGVSTALASHLAEKLPVSRLQRDLTDSTVLRNIGVPIAHTYIAIDSLQKGIHKLVLNESILSEELNDNWVILAEAIQTILRRESYKNPYEALKTLTRGKQKLTKTDLHNFIDQLDVTDSIKTELKALRPESYTGNAGKLF
ncbi:MAG: adenylosuccinate lyase [Saprospiraceae bacterium]|nr:adenylosuccinate lyase [Saprospiraceae bacterium]MBK7737131.1 adenylosuccinate lyase [Saprospiraceae bacterium]MBK7914274.1 adenylosuccinate lyase [Saprospiraceae bacterium]